METCAPVFHCDSTMEKLILNAGNNIGKKFIQRMLKNSQNRFCLSQTSVINSMLLCQREKRQSYAPIMYQKHVEW